MMLDADVVAVSPSSVWRVLKQAGLLSRWKAKPSRKGTGFEQPLAPHQHWHVDVSYINLSGTFYTCAACWMDAAVFWCIGICGNR
jgi:putative transposase